MSTRNNTTGTKEELVAFIEDQRAKITGNTYVSEPTTRPFSCGKYVYIFSEETDEKITVWYEKIGVDEDGETIYDISVEE